MKTLRLSAALAALALTASTACAAVIDFSNGLGPSGGYTSAGYYQSLLRGQPMTAAQHAYADQEGQLRLLGFLSELGGDIALGQIFYHMAYNISPGSDLRPPSTMPGGSVIGGSDEGDPGAGLTFDDAGSFSLVQIGGPGGGVFANVTAAPEASTWAMMLLGFAGLGLAGWVAQRRSVAVGFRA